MEPLNRHYSAWLNSAKASVKGLVRPLIFTSLLVTGVISGLRYLGLMEAAELAAYDQLVRLQPDAGIDDRILVVGVTETDLQTLEEWPISDRTLAQALTNLQAQRPQTIAIDIFRDFPNEPGTQELLTQFQQDPNIVIICKASSWDNPGTPPPPGVSPEQVGFADLVVDSGGILRRSLLMTGPPEPETPFPKQHQCNQPQQTLLSLSFLSALRYLEAQEIAADFTEDQQLHIGSTLIPQIRSRMGGYQGVDANGYQIMLAYRAAQQAVTEVSLMEVLNGQVDPALIRDRIVFIGYTTPQAKDDFYTPYSLGKDDNQKMAGVMVHAQAASQLLSTVLDGRPLIWAWADTVELLWILGWSVAGGLVAWYVRHPGKLSLAILSGSGSLYLLCLVTFTQGGWIPLVPPVLTFTGTAVGIVLLDRFNHSAYGQQVYRKVKSILRLKIEIDEEKLEKQVSEITETDYFRSLQVKVQNLRRRADVAAKEGVNSPWSRTHEAQPWKNEYPASGNVSQALDALRDADRPDLTADEYEVDFFQELHQKARSLRPSPEADHSSLEDDHNGGIALPRQPTPPFAAAKGRSHPPYVPFVLDEDYCTYSDESQSTAAYLAELADQLAHLQAPSRSDQSDRAD